MPTVQTLKRKNYLKKKFLVKVTLYGGKKIDFMFYRILRLVCFKKIIFFCLTNKKKKRFIFYLLIRILSKFFFLGANFIQFYRIIIIKNEKRKRIFNIKQSMLIDNLTKHSIVIFSRRDFIEFELLVCFSFHLIFFTCVLLHFTNTVVDLNILNSTKSTNSV